MINIELKEKLRTEILYKQEKSFFADGPVEYGSLGEFPSPTEMLLSATGSCMLMKIEQMAKQHNYNVIGTKISIKHEMVEPPKLMISKLFIDINFPFKFEKRKYILLKAATENCIVKNSLHPDIKLTINFRFSDGTIMN